MLSMPRKTAFLSCLRGSDLLVPDNSARCAFLSCLRGSDPRGGSSRARLPFLSCLRGSDREHFAECGQGHFLSCLRGSDPAVCRACAGNQFLSCLRGSDLNALAARLYALFLSCLRGSDLAMNYRRALIMKDKVGTSALRPKTCCGLQGIDFAIFTKGHPKKGLEPRNGSVRGKTVTAELAADRYRCRF